MQPKPFSTSLYQYISTSVHHFSTSVHHFITSLHHYIIICLFLGCQGGVDQSKVFKIADTVPRAVATVTSDTIPAPVKSKSDALDYNSAQWTDIQILDQTIDIDIRYATTNNFVKEQLYDCPRCFLRPDVAKAIGKIQKELQQKGLELKMFDCYRPKPIQQKLWDKVPDARYVTPPWKGSMHNRGMAVDLTIVDAAGKELDMGTTYDYFGEKAYHTYTNLPEKVLKNRNLLKDIMTRHGFQFIRTEWWHYSFKNSSHELSDWMWKCD